MPNLFNRVDQARVNRSVFNLSHEHSTTFDMGQLIPSLILEAVPGDIFTLQTELLIRLQPLVSPAFTEINATIHNFFVPYRILDDEWEDFITKGLTGENSYSLPLWNPLKKGLRSLWDYMGFPIDVLPYGAQPIDYVRRAYNAVYNEYYRDENLQDEVSADNEDVLYRAWEKDYFTSAFTSPQRGTAPALPISGTTFADFNNVLHDGGYDLQGENILVAAQDPRKNASEGPINVIGFRESSNPTPTDYGWLKNTLNKNVIDFSNATTFDLEDFRWTAVIQQTMERAMRGGIRYTEWLKSMYGVAPRDERLDRPEYIGGSKTPVIISEVLQTSQTTTDSPQGNLSGHGISYSNGRNGRYRVTEFGIIIGIISIIPRAMYHQGVSRQWTRRTPYDFFNPLFVNLGEQEIKESELYAQEYSETGISHAIAEHPDDQSHYTDLDHNHNLDIFGFQGIYNELRYMPSHVTGNLRPGQDMEHYTLVRDFDSPPGLNEAFIQCKPSKRIFAVQTDDPSFIVRMRHMISAVRPLPIQPIPGITRI